MSSIARVHVNGIEVGSLPADTYTAIVESVRKTRRLYITWALAFGALLLKKFFMVWRAIPELVLGILIAMALAAPEHLTSLIAALRAAEPEAVTQGIRSLLVAISMLCMVALPLSVLIAPQGWTIVSPFDAAISKKVRQLLEVPTEGELMVEIVEQPIQAA